jgi:four helix bundle protein
MKENTLKEKSFSFAVLIVDLFKNLQESKKEYILTKQLLRSGTSIGANIREAEFAESKSDFIHKLAIAQKECSETIYWIELLLITKYLDKHDFCKVHNNSIELMKLLSASIKTAKSNLTH